MRFWDIFKDFTKRLFEESFDFRPVGIFDRTIDAVLFVKSLSLLIGSVLSYYCGAVGFSGGCGSALLRDNPKTQSNYKQNCV